MSWGHVSSDTKTRVVNTLDQSGDRVLGSPVSMTLKRCCWVWSLWLYRSVTHRKFSFNFVLVFLSNSFGSYWILAFLVMDRKIAIQGVVSTEPARRAAGIHMQSQCSCRWRACIGGSAVWAWLMSIQFVPGTQQASRWDIPPLAPPCLASRPGMLYLVT